MFISNLSVCQKCLSWSLYNTILSSATLLHLNCHWRTWEIAMNYLKWSQGKSDAESCHQVKSSLDSPQASSLKMRDQFRCDGQGNRWIMDAYLMLSLLVSHRINWSLSTVLNRRSDLNLEECSTIQAVHLWTAYHGVDLRMHNGWFA